MSALILVMCVRRHSVKKVVLYHIYTYIVVSSLILVVSVIRRSVKRAVLEHINAYKFRTGKANCRGELRSVHVAGWISECIAKDCIIPVRQNVS
jgi:hypothetical protein